MAVDYRFQETSLRQIIAARGFRSLDEFARSIGLHRNTLFSYLKGEKSILSNAALRISSALGIDALEFSTARKTFSNFGALDKKIEGICEEAARRDNALVFFLIGSRATGQQHKFSDYDIGLSRAAEGLDTDSYLSLRVELEEACDELPVGVDFLNFDTAPVSFLEELDYSPKYIAGSKDSFSYVTGKLDGIRCAQKAH